MPVRTIRVVCKLLDPYYKPLLWFMILYPIICISTGDPFFDNSTREVQFEAFTNFAQTRIRVVPNKVQGSDLHFTVTLVVPPAAMTKGVVLGEPNVVMYCVYMYVYLAVYVAYNIWYMCMYVYMYMYVCIC